jgi:lantibiotic modifying enzyme
MLFDPASHEPITERPWDERRARVAIAAVVADAESAFDEQSLWPAHPLDEEDDEPLVAVASLYLGASGVIWAFHQLERVGAVELHRDWAPVAVSLADRYLSQPDFQDVAEGPVPSLLMGEAGILLVAHTMAPATWQEDRLLEAVRANAANPFWELMWGSPGTMIAAQVLYERTGAERWLEAWSNSADLLWARWHDDLWLQDLYGRPLHVLGPVHGFAGNVFALARGDLLDPARRAELERRAIATTAKYARRAGGLCQWPPALEAPRTPRAVRTQWCHGAPGIVASLASLAPHDEQLTELLLAGGELTWRAGPLEKGANLCHGTAGNGYAFLKLFERTSNELWLERARRFAMHAIEHIEQATAKYGRGRHSLWTGDLGTALYLHDCLTATAAFPTLDSF